MVKGYQHSLRNFNSQPHEEADDLHPDLQRIRRNFNSQPHEEADKKSTNCITIASDISTHSLTKRLTGKKPSEKCHHHIISTHSLTKRLTGGRPHCRKAAIYFNSQPHEEADGAEPDQGSEAAYFNSQPHEEADGNFRQKYIYLKLFFTLIAHINLVFYSNHYIVNFFLVKYTHFLVRMS